MILNFAFYLITVPYLVTESLSDTAYIILFWVIFTIDTLAAAGIAHVISKKFFQLKPVPPLTGLWDSLKIRSGEWGAQIKIALVLLLIIYVPLDLIGYYIPGMLEYSATSLTLSQTGNYLNWDLAAMLPIALIIHFCVAVREEFLIRNYMINVGMAQVGSSTILIYSAAYFGLAHFNYIFSAVGLDYPIFFPLYWGFSAMIIGLTAGFILVRKGWLWPLIWAHWLNNVISSNAVRAYLAQIPFSMVVKSLYIPLLIAGAVVFLLNMKMIRNGGKALLSLLMRYKEENTAILPRNVTLGEKSDQKNESLSIPVQNTSLGAYILLDMFIILILWFLSLVLL